MIETAASPEPTRSITPVHTAGDRSPFRALHDEMDRFLSSLYLPQIAWGADSVLGDGSLGMRVDIAETDNEIEVKADLPGIDEDKVEVSLEGDILRLHAEKSRDEDRKEQNWRVRERAFGSFDRSIRVPQGIKPDSVEAVFEKGVLTVKMPKPANGAGAKRIEVKAK